MRFARLATLALVLMPLGPVMADEIPGREAYAYGFPLTVEGASEFFAATVPLELYRSVTDPNLRDAGVYNAAGQAVPRVFEHPAEEQTDVEQSVPLGLVPLFGDQADVPEQLRLLLRRDAAGTLLELDTPEQSAASDAVQASPPLAAYIVDTRELEPHLEYLEFSWPEQHRGFMGSVSIDDSDDLQHWRTLGSATLADLDYADTQIGQRRAALARQPADFIRITWRNMPDDWSLLAVHGIHTTPGASTGREWLALDAQAVGESAREYVFDAGGYPPVDRVNLLLPDENVVVRASVLHRREGEESWRSAANGIFYNINRQGNALRSEPVGVAGARVSHWKVRFDSGTTQGPVKLQLGWRPDRLVFVAQGAAPFELVAGRAADRLEHFPQHSVLGDTGIFRSLRESGMAGRSSVGPRAEIAGSSSLSLAPASAWRTTLLWAGLTGAILLVGWLVWSLARQMREQGQGTRD